MKTKQEIQELIERVSQNLPLYAEDLITTLYEPIVAKHHIKTESLLKDTLTALQEYQEIMDKWQPIETLYALKETKTLILVAYKYSNKHTTDFEVTLADSVYDEENDRTLIWDRNSLQNFPISPTHWKLIDYSGLDNDN